MPHRLRAWQTGGVHVRPCRPLVLDLEIVVLRITCTWRWVVFEKQRAGRKDEVLPTRKRIGYPYLRERLANEIALGTSRVGEALVLEAEAVHVRARVRVRYAANDRAFLGVGAPLQLTVLK